MIVLYATNLLCHSLFRRKKNKKEGKYMKCTSCGEATLNSSYLEPQLPCYTCPACNGSLLMLSDFLRWKENHDSKDLIANTATIEVQETSKAMLCPKTGGLMTKYKISKDTEHRLDLSPTINAVWMDKGEWELLKEKGLAGKINAIFTDHWQEEIRSEESADILSALYKRKFGSHYEDIKAFRELIGDKKYRSEAIAYLLAEDPYSP